MMMAWCSAVRGWKLGQCAGEFMDRSLSCCEANFYYLQSVVRVRGRCHAVVASRSWWQRAPMRHVGVMAVSERGDQSKCHLDWSGLAHRRLSMRGQNPCSHRLGETTNPSAFIGQRGDGSWARGRQARSISREKYQPRACGGIPRGQKRRGFLPAGIFCGCRRPRHSSRGWTLKQVSTCSKPCDTRKSGRRIRPSARR